MKKRTLTISLIVLAIMLLVGIGYAGWVISSTTSGEAAGNFTAYNVETENLTVSNGSDTSVVLGFATPNSAFANPWLTYDVEVAAEDLAATFTISWSNNVTSGSEVTLNLDHKFYVGSSEVTGTDLTNLQKLISGPTYTLNVAASVAEVSGGNSIILKSGYTADTVITVTVTYSWGPSFGNTNPYLFFNGNTASAAPSASYASPAEATYEALAQNTLAALFGFTDSGLEFKVAVSKAA